MKILYFYETIVKAATVFMLERWILHYYWWTKRIETNFRELSGVNHENHDFYMYFCFLKIVVVTMPCNLLNFKLK